MASTHQAITSMRGIRLAVSLCSALAIAPPPSMCACCCSPPTSWFFPCSALSAPRPARAFKQVARESTPPSSHPQRTLPPPHHPPPPQPQELGPDKHWVSETLFGIMFALFAAWTFSPFVLQHKRFYTAVMWSRLLMVLVGECAHI